MVSTKTVAVDVRELRNAFDFVSAGDPFDHGAWICLDTGKIYWQSSASGLDDDEGLPEDIDDADRYLAVPSQHDLDLGQRLARTFAARELPDDYDRVVGFFRRRGAFGRFKDLLQRRGRLASWYEFEKRETDEALLAWCAEHQIELVMDKSEA